MAMVKFGQGLYSSFATSTKDPNQIFFTTDTKQLFLGENEYTKGTKVLNAAPTDSTVGNPGTLYAYDSNLYLCEGYDSTQSKYIWTRVANINDVGGSVTSVDATDGVETESGSAITSTGTIKHSVPTGATTLTDPTADAAPSFGSTFAIQGVATDKFGHVTASNTHTITIPEESVLDITDVTGTPETLASGSTFAAVTEVSKGAGSHDITQTTTVFTLPESDTYTISSTDEGIVTLTPSHGNASTAKIDGWDDLAKKTDITAIFRFKGTVADVEHLPTTGEVGDVYHVTAANAEYVCITASTQSTDAVWEELGTDIDLSEYAKSADVIQRVTGVEGEVPKFKVDGTVESTGFTLGCSVPSTAVFTDTTYDPATTAVDGLMSSTDKAKLDSIEADAEVNIIEVVKAAGTALTVDPTDRSVDVTLSSLGISSAATTIDAAVAAVEWNVI